MARRISDAGRKESRTTTNRKLPAWQGGPFEPLVNPLLGLLEKNHFRLEEDRLDYDFFIRFPRSPRCVDSPNSQSGGVADR